MSLRLSYFPGCVLRGSTREYDLATRAVAAALDVELVELPHWNCCGGVSVASLKADALGALGRRILEQVPADAPELLCPCPHCYTNLARARQSAGEKSAAELRDVLDVFGREEVLARLIERREEPLTDLRMVAYYGCKLFRPDPEALSLRRLEAGTQVQAAGAPTPRGEAGAKPLERIIEACGATVVEWPRAGDCCGSALGVAEPEVADELLGRIFQAALACEADAIVVACPLCHLNLDLRQYQVSQRLGRSVDIPIFYVSELMAVALGMDESEGWLERHVTSPLPMFMRWIEAQEEREYWGEEAPPSGPPGKAESPPTVGASAGGEADAATVASGAPEAEGKGAGDARAD